MTRSLIGERFTVTHAAGETEYEVSRPHPFDAGYFECTAVRAVAGSHHFLGSLQIVHRAAIVQQQRARDGGASFEGATNVGLDY